MLLMANIMLAFLMNVSSINAYARPDTLKYDDGSAERWTTVNPSEWDENMMAIQFEMPDYTYFLKSAIFYLRGKNSERTVCYAAVRKDKDGLPDSTDIMSVTMNIPDRSDTPAWYEAKFDTTKTEFRSRSKFWLVLKWDQDTPDSPYIGVDQGNDGHSYWYQKSRGWRAYSSGEWMIRAIIVKSTGFNNEKTSAYFKPAKPLLEIYPVPVRTTARIDYYIPEQYVSKKVKLTAVDMTGRKTFLYSGFANKSGYRNFTLNSSRFPAGLYFIMLEIDNQIADTKKIVIMR
ncbi:MAG: T9SS type A sorting domain-containing protein [Candidatus Coatesbacteria bacterium]|nr:T9SS type A sorting domain-containing protein [Candidatus Coatesbacteria bacterium]